MNSSNYQQFELSNVRVIDYSSYPVFKLSIIRAIEKGLLHTLTHNTVYKLNQTECKEPEKKVKKNILASLLIYMQNKKKNTEKNSRKISSNTKQKDGNKN